MKNYLIIVVLLYAAQMLTPAQNVNTAFCKTSWELNFTGSMGSVESNEEMSSPFYYGGYSHSESRTYLQFGIIPAYYIIDGLAIEPELNIWALQKSKPAFLLLGNLAYTFKIDSSRFFPFIRAGYGITNSVQIPVNTNLTKLSNDMDIGVLNFGAGLKTLLTDCVLLRTEINYRKFSYKHDTDYSNYTLDLSSIALVFGFSVLL